MFGPGVSTRPSATSAMPPISVVIAAAVSRRDGGARPTPYEPTDRSLCANYDDGTAPGARPGADRPGPLGLVADVVGPRGASLGDDDVVAVARQVQPHGARDRLVGGLAAVVDVERPESQQRNRLIRR